LTDLTPSHLEESRARHYEKAVPPEEDSLKSSSDTILHAASVDHDCGIFVEEVLLKKSESEIPAVQEFIEMCKNQLQNSEPSLCPKLSTLLDHVFFTLKFIRIHSFLV
jgi:hypothetical protein